MLEDSEYAIACQKLLTDQALAPASIYFKYYLHLALAKGGLAQDYTNWLGKWKENLDYGLTTWAEMSDLTNSRSDCHAWGSSPNIEFFRVFLGIDSGAPGFQRVHIEPHLGSSTFARGSIPHHRGTISVLYQMKGEVLNAEVILPSGIPGEFVWKGRTVALSPGINKFSL